MKIDESIYRFKIRMKAFYQFKIRMKEIYQFKIRMKEPKFWESHDECVKDYISNLQKKKETTFLEETTI